MIKFMTDGVLLKEIAQVHVYIYMSSCHLVFVFVLCSLKCCFEFQINTTLCATPNILALLDSIHI